MTRRVLACASALLLSACVSIDYDSLKPGGFTGSLIVMWVGPGTTGSGDGQFVFVPDPAAPLTFTRPGNGAGKVIRPGVMYTDGGSIPRVAQVFKGFNPWGYAPAYMIHDWLFTARHCIVDGQSNAEYDRLKDVTFEDSAVILGEAIRGLVAANQVDKDDVAGGTITWAVGSGIAKNLWDSQGACAAEKVSDQHLAQIELAVPGSTTLSVTQQGVRTMRAIRRAAPGIAPAQVVSTVRF
ncbi:DUF1353 domain-containing protein [Aliirhizobium terrae]|uniref:hypothetical protein n=1 Tax=Terrirhizobium terrae TaxID=2926709 RepID=UPI002574B240|nr:hypothetical protein [Rhizobium sp. CC-CFT758]WJH39372.1 DUF1353 domain-containing protein [Rhizobium sp. CC-CFT758]